MGELIIEVAASAGIPADDLFAIITGGQAVEIHGTYAHPKLILHIAAWASPAFAVMVSDIVNKHFINEAMRERDVLLGKKDDKIDELSKKIDNQSRQIAELLGYAKDTKATLDKTAAVLDDTKATLEDTIDELHVTEATAAAEQAKLNAVIADTHKKVADITVKLGISNERRVPRDPTDNQNEVLVIMRRPNTNEYKASRCQYKNSDRLIKTSISQGFVKMVYYKEDSNAVNIWNRVKQNMTGATGLIHGAYRIIAFDEAALVNFIKSVELEKTIM